MQYIDNLNRRGGHRGVRATTRLRRLHGGRVFACLAAIAVCTGSAQQASQVAPGQFVKPDIPVADSNRLPDANAQTAMRDRQTSQQKFEAANAARKKQIADDSARLLKLAADLKAEVDKTSKDTLSLTVIRKADEIERLAHAVKEKMKLSVGAN